MDRMGYQSLISYENQVDATGDDNAPPPNDHNVMVHVVPEHNKTRWNHVEDLDSFFTRIYYYHQKHGFVCIVLQECFELLQFIFVVGFATFLLQCVDYPVLFKDKAVNTTSTSGKIGLHDAIIPAGQCISEFSPWMWIVLLVALIFWLLRLVFVIYNTSLNWEIRAFYRTALGIADSELDNLTWYDVQRKLRDVQRDQQMCIHKQDLSELDIYHRILRFKNYMVAMVNKHLLPLQFQVPILGETVFLTHGLKYNLEMLLFWGPWAPFENSWHLRADYKKVSKRKELAQALSKRILWIGIANFALSPIIFLWQILYSFFNYAEIVKREPGTLGTRRWSIYGRLFLRHFNELEHQLNARLSRAYRPAAKYMSIFNAPLMTIIAQNVAFVSGAVFAVLSLLAIYDEDVLTIEHVLLLITVLGAVMAVCRAFIPDEQLVWCPERLLTGVLAHVHYFPDQWKGKAHTTRTRDQFSHLFEYKATYLIQELLSPFLTPVVLCFYLRPKALEIVDFYRNFTVEVIGVGDVCSFAQMDVRKHGSPTWQASIYDMDGSELPSKNSYIQAENGKTELSLVHFTHTNPEWKPPNDAGTYITNLKERAAKDAANLPTLFEENPLFASLNSISSLGNEYSNVVTSLMYENQLLNPILPNVQSPDQSTNSPNSSQSRSRQPSSQGQGDHNIHTNYTYSNPMQNSFRGSMSRLEGPLNHGRRGIVAGLNQSGVFSAQLQSTNMLSFANSFANYPNSNVSQRVGNVDPNVYEVNAVDMSLDALYLHELHHMELRRRTSGASAGAGGARGYAPNSSVFQQNNNQQLQNFPFYQSQPQLHMNVLGQNQQNTHQSSSTTEKTPLLAPHNAYRS